MGLWLPMPGSVPRRELQCPGGTRASAVSLSLTHRGLCAWGWGACALHVLLLWQVPRVQNSMPCHAEQRGRQGEAGCVHSFWGAYRLKLAG